MSDLFSADFYAANRKRLRALFQGTAPIVIAANGILQKSTDDTFAFKQDGNFLYLTGLTLPDLVLVLDKDKEYIILPEQSQYQKDFHGAHDIKAIARTSGVATVMREKDGWKQLGGRLKKVKHLATLPAAPNYVDVYGFYANPARGALLERIKTYNPDLELLDLRKHFGIMRMVKQPEEVQAVQQAIDITVKSLQRIKKRIDKYAHEYEIEADLTHGFRVKGANGHAFDPIVASGAHACVVHHMANNGAIGQKDLVLLDVGAEYQGYAADISRTYAASSPTKRQQQVYDAVREVQDYAYSLLKPGATIREYEKQIEQFMGEKLRTLGLIKNVEREEIRRYYPHATSHYLGIDVHDVGDYDRPLEPNMILTVEPGIYIPEEAIGVRIEDDVIVTETGITKLSSKLDNGL